MGPVNQHSTNVLELGQISGVLLPLDSRRRCSKYRSDPARKVITTRRDGASRQRNPLNIWSSEGRLQMDPNATLFAPRTTALINAVYD
jgi:hypothetical protein